MRISDWSSRVLFRSRAGRGNAADAGARGHPAARDRPWRSGQQPGTRQRRGSAADGQPDRAPAPPGDPHRPRGIRSEEHTSELQSLMRISYAVFCLKKKKKNKHKQKHNSESNKKTNKHNYYNKLHNTTQ